MAEAFGAAASALSIIQVAAQLAASIDKLKKFWNQVKEAPSDIKHLMRELDLLDMIINELQKDQVLGLEHDHAYVQNCLKHCIEGSNELQSIVLECQRLLQRERKWKQKAGAVRTVLKFDDIRSLKAKLESAVNLLRLALTAYQCHKNARMHASIQILPEMLTSKLLGILSPPATTTPRLQPGDIDTPKKPKDSKQLVTKKYTYWSSAAYLLDTLIGSLEYRKRHKKHRGRLGAEISAKYQSPSWLARRAWEMTVHKGRFSLQVALRTYRTLQLGTPIFVAARKGDLEWMKKLLESREGYVNDRDDHGSTLLHIAALNGHHKMCKLLIEEGADVLERNCISRAPLDWALTLQRKDSEADLVETVRVLVEAGASESLIQDLDFLRNYNNCSTGAFAYLSRQCFPSYHQLSVQECVGVAIDLAACGLRLPVDGDSFQVFRLALQPVSLKEAAQTRKDPGGVTTRNQMTLLHASAYRLIMEAEHDVSLDQTHWRMLNCEHTWRVFIRDLIKAGADVSAIDSGGHSPFHDLLNYFAGCPDDPKGPVQVLKAWLSDLKEAGVELEQYGQGEFALHQALATGSECCRHFPRNVSFRFGPQVDDWHFWMRGPNNNFASQFWRMVERRTSESTEGENIAYERRNLDMPCSWRDFEENKDDDVDSDGSDDFL